MFCVSRTLGIDGNRSSSTLTLTCCREAMGFWITCSTALSGLPAVVFGITCSAVLSWLRVPGTTCSFVFPWSPTVFSGISCSTGLSLPVSLSPSPLPWSTLPPPSPPPARSGRTEEKKSALSPDFLSRSKWRIVFKFWGDVMTNAFLEF